MLRGGGLRSLAGGVCVRGGFGRWDACGASDGPHVETGSGIAALAPWHVLLLAAWVLDRDPETSRDVALVAHSAGCPS
jgi:hypothetical protein